MDQFSSGPPNPPPFMLLVIRNPSISHVLCPLFLPHLDEWWPCKLSRLKDNMCLVTKYSFQKSLNSSSKFLSQAHYPLLRMFQAQSVAYSFCLFFYFQRTAHFECNIGKIWVVRTTLDSAQKFPGSQLEQDSLNLEIEIMCIASTFCINPSFCFLLFGIC